MRAAQRAAGSWRADEDARRAALRAAAAATLAAAGDLAALLTAEQGKPLKAAAFEVAEMALLAGVLGRAGPAPDGAPGRRARPRRTGAASARRGRGDHALELPAAAGRVEAGTRPAGRQHRGAQAVAVHAAVHPGPGPRPGRGPAARCAQRGQRRRRAGGLDDLPPGRGEDQLHRVGARLARRSPRRPPPTSSGSPSNSAATTRRSCSTTPTRRSSSRGLFWGAFINNGQICAGIKRIYVPEALHGDVVEALAHRARPGPGRGPGTDAGVQLGPIQNQPQFDRVNGLVAGRPGPRRRRPRRAATRWTGTATSSSPPS